MKTKTKRLTQQVRDALLACSNKVLLETIIEWLDRTDEYFQYADWSDHFRYTLGYQVASDTTEVVYDSFDALEAAEPDFMGITWVVPDAETLRNILTSFSIDEFYHTIIPLADYALHDNAYEQKWGHAPSSYSDGYDFMRSLATHLHKKTYRKPEHGQIIFLPDVARRRKSASTTTPAFARSAALETFTPRESQSSHSPDWSDQNHDLDH